MVVVQAQHARDSAAAVKFIANTVEVNRGGAEAGVLKKRRRVLDTVDSSAAQ